MFPFSLRCLFASLTLTNCILYAAYQSWKSINAKDLNATSDWMAYWTVIGVLLAFEWFFEFLTFLLPFYNEFKILLLLFLVFSPGNGSRKVFDNFLIPFIQNYKLDKRAQKCMQFVSRISITWAGAVYIGLIRLATNSHLLDAVFVRQLVKTHMDIIVSLPYVKFPNDDADNHHDDVMVDDGGNRDPATRRRELTEQIHRRISSKF